MWLTRVVDNLFACPLPKKGQFELYHTIKNETCWPPMLISESDLLKTVCNHENKNILMNMDHG